MIKQFLTDVVWGTRDYLIIDTPPGTSDEHISVVENIKTLNPDGAVLVTTPQVHTIEEPVHWTVAMLKSVVTQLASFLRLSSQRKTK